MTLQIYVIFTYIINKNVTNVILCASIRTAFKIIANENDLYQKNVVIIVRFRIPAPVSCGLRLFIPHKIYK